MFDPRARASRPVAMLSVVLLLSLAFVPTAMAQPSDDERPSISLDFVVDLFSGWMQNLVDAAYGVIDGNGQPAAPPAPTAPPEPTADDPTNPGDTELGGVIDGNG
ncbi:MAG: hypothetical protein AAGE94_05990 [Acidobacteriota bacterium]